jgi:hypothetical protein
MGFALFLMKIRLQKRCERFPFLQLRVLQPSAVPVSQR